MPPRLTSTELEVMQVLWDHGELKPSQIQEHFERPIKNPALRSLLSILVEKQHIERRKEGKAFFYTAKTRRQSAFRSMLREVTDLFCEGSSKALLMNLIKTEKLSEQELVDLKRIADESDAAPKPAKKKKRQRRKQS